MAKIFTAKQFMDSYSRDFNYCTTTPNLNNKYVFLSKTRCNNNSAYETHFGRANCTWSTRNETKKKKRFYFVLRNLRVMCNCDYYDEAFLGSEGTSKSKNLSSRAVQLTRTNISTTLVNYFSYFSAQWYSSSRKIYRRE